jgi:superfamily I DNA/RNA helicase
VASLAKGALVTDEPGLIALALAHGVDMGVSEARFADRVLELLRLTNLFDVQAEEQIVDYDDMVWWPAVNSDLVWIPQYDIVMLDECQDLTPAQIQLAFLAMKPDGRMIAVGDEKQGIFSFRGADKEAIPHIRTRLKPTELPLTTTFRCATSIVTEAQRYVPDIRAREGAPAGEVRHTSLAKALEEVEYGDFVLSRTNAPLVNVALSLIATGCAVKILGREIGNNLVTLLYKLGAERVDQLEPLARQWLDRKTQKLMVKEPPAEDAVKLAADQVSCIIQLARAHASVGNVAEAIRELFVDDSSKDCVTLATTHKAKGLEANRVYLLWNTFLRPRRGQVTEEEYNIAYCSVTRAKTELIYVR